MPFADYTMNVTVAGLASSKTVRREADHPNPYQITLPVAHALSSWVKTDADTAAGNLSAGHGQTDGVYDVYWEGGSRYGVDVVISTNAVALDGGAGDDFPASATATVRICKQKQINTAIDGDEIKLAFVKLQYIDEATVARGHLVFQDADDDVIADLDDEDGIAANKTNVYDVQGGDANPFTGDPITVCYATHDNVSAAATLLIATLEDSTP